jgi:hypothetical protein
MKFGRNQPRSQPIVRVAHRSHSPCVYPATRPLQGPLSPSLTVAPEHQVRRGEDDNELYVSAHTPAEA